MTKVPIIKALVDKENCNFLEVVCLKKSNICWLHFGLCSSFTYINLVMCNQQDTEYHSKERCRRKRNRENTAWCICEGWSLLLYSTSTVIFGEVTLNSCMARNLSFVRTSFITTATFIMSSSASTDSYSEGRMECSSFRTAYGHTKKTHF